MSDGEPPVSAAMEKIAAAVTRAGAELAESFRAAAEALGKIAQDPRVQAAISADREPARAGCHCLCGAAHPDDPRACDGRSVTTVRMSGMDVPMCAPCQAARAASRLSGQA
jgi:hypothetical protein